MVRVTPATAALVAAGDAPKGDVLSVARIAGIQGGKRTSELIPLCHPLALSFLGVEASIDVDAGEITIVAEARTTGPTGVEMEALTAASVAALTVYDMVKGVSEAPRSRRSRWSPSPAVARGSGTAPKPWTRASITSSSRIGEWSGEVRAGSEQRATSTGLELAAPASLRSEIVLSLASTVWM